MRDNHHGFPEIRQAYERDGLYFGVVRVETKDETASFEFGVEYKGYLALRRILESRPFDNLPGIQYRYFYAGRYSRRVIGQEPVTIGIRVEQGEIGKVYEFDCPTSLASNLRWFESLPDFSEAGRSSASLNSHDSRRNTCHSRAPAVPAAELSVGAEAGVAQPAFCALVTATGKSSARCAAAA